jgi:hypothetical protein
MSRQARLYGLALLFTAVLVNAASARQWTDEVFENKVSAGRPFVAVASRDPARAHSVIGSSRFYPAQEKDTFLDIARYYGLGYNDLAE